MPPHDKQNNLRAQLVPVLVLTSIFFFNFCSRIMVAPLSPNLEKVFELTHGDSGSLFFILTLGYFIALFNSGFVSSRLSHRQTILLSNSGLGVALLFTLLVTGKWGLRIELFFIGLMAGLYLPSGIATVTSLVSQRHWGIAISIHELAPNLSFVLAPIITEIILLKYSWRAVFLILGVVTILLSGAFCLFGRGGDFHGLPPSPPAIKKLLSNPSFWIIIALFALGVGGTLGIYAMLPLYLVNDHGMGQQWANTLISISRISCIVAPFLAAWIADRHGPESTLRILFLFIAITTVLLGVLPTQWLIPAVVLQPIFAVSFFPVGFAALSRICSPEERSLTISMAVPFSFLIGGGAIPYCIGLIGDLGYLGWGFVLVGTLSLTGTILPAYLRYRGEPTAS